MPGANDYLRYSSVPRIVQPLSDMQRALAIQVPVAPKFDSKGREIVPHFQPMDANTYLDKVGNKPLPTGQALLGADKDPSAEADRILRLGS